MTIAITVILLGFGSLYLLRGGRRTAVLTETLFRVVDRLSGCLVMFVIFWAIFSSSFFALEGQVHFVQLGFVFAPFLHVVFMCV